MKILNLTKSSDTEIITILGNKIVDFEDEDINELKITFNKKNPETEVQIKKFLDKEWNQYYQNEKRDIIIYKDSDGESENCGC